MADDVDLALQCLEDIFKDGRKLGPAFDIVDKDHELVAAEAAYFDAVAGKPGQLFRDGVDEAVADGMTERIIDALEVVEIEDDERAIAFLIAGRHHLACELVEIGAIYEPGQVVVAGHRADLFLGLDARRDILESDHAEAAGALAHRELDVAPID